MLGDQADLVDSSNFGGKINEVLQAFFDNLTYLKNEVDSFTSVAIANQTQGRSGTNNTAAMSSLRVLDALRNGSNFAANTTRKGVSERATQVEVNTGTDTEKHLTPDTFNDSDAIQLILPAATATISVSSGSIMVIQNIVIGNVLFMRVKATSAIASNSTWTLGGGAWRFISVTFFDDSLNGLELGLLDHNNNTALQDIVHNSNNTTFTAGLTTVNMEIDDIINIIAVLN